MALSAQDKAFYEEKLALNSYGYIFGFTVLIGVIGWPLLFFIQDAMLGLGSRWTASIVFDYSVIGGLLGSVVGIAMYLFFKMLLELGWLPKRR
jgi:hypothetical protein